MHLQDKSEQRFWLVEHVRCAIIMRSQADTKIALLGTVRLNWRDISLHPNFEMKRQVRSSLHPKLLNAVLFLNKQEQTSVTINRKTKIKTSIMGNASSVKTAQLCKKSTATHVTDRFGKAAAGKHVIITGTNTDDT